MSSKRFKGRTCAYCCLSPSDTGDHIFAREFFLEKHRENLPKAPACKACNNEKSKLEHYLTAVLPLAGRHRHAEENLLKLVPKRLNKNRKLHRYLGKNQSEVSIVEGGVREERLAMPIEYAKVEKLFEFIIKGLAWHHWKVYLSGDFPIEVIALSPKEQEYFQRTFFSMKPKNRELVDLGNRTVVYEGVQGVDCPEITVWRFHMYGGMLLADQNGHASSEIGGLSGPARAQE